MENTTGLAHTFDYLLNFFGTPAVNHSVEVVGPVVTGLTFISMTDFFKAGKYLANHIRDLLQKLLCNVEISIIKVSTKSDRNKSDFLYKSESVAFFTSEIEKMLLNTQADITVHSLKDLPAGATVGTSSLCRIAQLKHRGGDLKCVPLRGNILTRIGKVLYYQSNVTSFQNELL